MYVIVYMPLYVYPVNKVILVMRVSSCMKLSLRKVYVLPGEYNMVYYLRRACNASQTIHTSPGSLLCT